ncbi:Zinc finger HIT domain-containing protein 2 [Pseudolycoriella hygida]|uniref:Zinc finger HIT domain-containing protein 2 n=1 Tax=Pseudolycoriella hygida TaxID=35572 RepID=A0A9Q0RWP5_9DIPT|nr:Zinc finger HIT domain-containing protein 2 [Pseudolycoriella hygida]
MRRRCLKEPQKYCCPRCNIQYCSVACYKSTKHSQCSESFYKDCVMQEMALQSANQNSQQRCGTLDDIPGLSDDIKRMYAILKRMESHESNGSDIGDFDIEDFDSDDDEELTELDLTTRLSGIDLDNADAIWSKLTSDEKHEFEKIAASGDVMNLLPPYEAWWTKGKKLIEEISDTQNASSKPPEILKTIVNFDLISSKPPADCVKHNLKNVLAAYALSVRFFNGEHVTSTHEFTNYFVSVCANVKLNFNFDDDDIAIESVVHSCRNEGLAVEASQVKLLHEDVQQITKSSSFVLAALSDIHRSMTQAKRSKFVNKSSNEKSEFSRKFFDYEIVNFQNLDKTKLNASIKKVEYYLALVAKYKDTVFSMGSEI